MSKKLISSRKQKAESRKQKAESRKQKAESRKQKAESRKIVAAVDLSVKNPKLIKIANCITAKENRGISNVQSIGNGVVIAIIKRCSK